MPPKHPWQKKATIDELHAKVIKARSKVRMAAKREHYKEWRALFLKGRTYASIGRSLGKHQATIHRGVMLTLDDVSRDELNRLHRAAVRAKHARRLAKQKARAEVRAGWERVIS